MKTHEDIQQIAEKLGIKVTVNTKSFKELHKYIHDNEDIISIVDANTSLAVITDQKVMSITTNLLSPPDAKEIPLKNISNMEVNAGFIYTELKIIATGQILKIAFQKKDNAIVFKNKVNDIINSSKQDNTSTSAPQVDILSQLERLGKLKDQGILTEAEFTEQKQKLLSQL